MKKFAIAVIALAVLAVGMAMADDPMPPTAETQGISTMTAVTCVGTVTNTETVVWTMSNQDLRNNPPLNQYWPDPNVVGNLIWTPERQYVMSYSEFIAADNGYIEFNGLQTVDTAARTANQNNFASTEQFDYFASETAMGRITTFESILLDGACQGDDATRRMLCPFAVGDANYIPAYCNVVEMGSSFTGTVVSAVTGANERHVSTAADVPVSMNYNVALGGQGSAAAWINAHLLEGRTGQVDNAVPDPNNQLLLRDRVPTNPDRGGEGFMQGLDLVYKERTTASGTIAAFSKSMSYQSGLRRI